MAQPDLPLKKYLQNQIKLDRQTLALLRKMRRDVDEQLKRLVGNRPGVAVRRDQLRLVAREIDRTIDRAWAQLRDNIERQALVAAKDAVLANGDLEKVLVRAGLSGLQIAALEASNAAVAQQSVRQALNRRFDETGATRIPLSDKVYHSRQLIKGAVDDLVDSALARGLSAREFAQEARRFIDPNTPGGVRYAANRLARTELNNAFHYAQTRDSAAKPWISGQKWHLSGSHPRPDECNVFAARNIGMGPGVFKPDDVPNKPHPNCLCYIEPISVGEDDWIRQFNAGKYDDYLNSRMPTGLPTK